MFQSVNDPLDIVAHGAFSHIKSSEQLSEHEKNLSISAIKRWHNNVRCNRTLLNLRESMVNYGCAHYLPCGMKDLSNEQLFDYYYQK